MSDVRAVDMRGLERKLFQLLLENLHLKGFTLSRLAEMCDVSQPMIRRWISGEASPTYVVVRVCIPMLETELRHLDTGATP